MTFPVARAAAYLGFLLVLPFITPTSSDRWLIAKADATEEEFVLKDHVGKCVGVQIAKVAEAWKTKLGMQDWESIVLCTMPKQYGKSHVGLSFTDVMSRQIIIFINPDEGIKIPRDKVVVHELLHGLVTQAKEAKSDVVDEQTVQTLTTLVMAGPVSLPCLEDLMKPVSPEPAH